MSLQVAIANSNTDPFVRVALQEQGIKPHRDPWIAVDSSCIDAIAYLETESLLKIRFNTGYIYRYDHVPHNTFLNLLDADSKGAECTAKQALELNSRELGGSYFNRHIKDIFPYRQI